jgi:hypothetical protein
MDILSVAGSAGNRDRSTPVTRSMFDGPQHTASAENPVRKPGEPDFLQ